MSLSVVAVRITIGPIHKWKNMTLFQYSRIIPCLPKVPCQCTYMLLLTLLKKKKKTYQVFTFLCLCETNLSHLCHLTLVIQLFFFNWHIYASIIIPDFSDPYQGSIKTHLFCYTTVLGMLAGFFYKWSSLDMKCQPRVPFAKYVSQPIRNSTFCFGVKSESFLGAKLHNWLLYFWFMCKRFKMSYEWL